MMSCPSMKFTQRIENVYIDIDPKWQFLVDFIEGNSYFCCQQ
jgi:hypothetical protein